MKKLLLFFCSVFLLSACAEKNQFEQAVLEQMQQEQDVKDYHLDPQRMAQCVIDMTSRNMPGFLPIEPRRKNYYIGITKLITLKESDNPGKELQEARGYFDSPKDAMQAMMNYSQNIMECLAALIAETDEEDLETQ